MSRSILKVHDSDKGRVAIPASERSDGDSDDDRQRELTPWEPPLFGDSFQREVARMQKDLDRLQQGMLLPLPVQPLLPPPPPLPQLQMAPMPNLLMDTPSPSLTLKQDMASSDVGWFHPPGNILAQNGLNTSVFTPLSLPSLPQGPMPVIKDTQSGLRIMELNLDVKGFQPEDIRINTEGQVLQVHARHVDVQKGGRRDVMSDSKSASEFRRQFTLPEVVRAENLQCFVNSLGQLTISGPLGAEVIRREKKKVKFAFKQ